MSPQCCSPRVDPEMAAALAEMPVPIGELAEESLAAEAPDLVPRRAPVGPRARRGQRSKES